MIEIRECGLTLIRTIPNPGKDENGKYKLTKGVYKCVCGNTKEIAISDVKSGHVKSCGCYKRVQNGLCWHPLYFIWSSMFDRCYREDYEPYPLYGGKGVRMCDEWYNSFMYFYKWALKNGWKKGLQLDKDIKAKEAGIEGFLYSPEWCTFVPPIENNKGKGKNVLKEYNGRSQTLSQWGRELGLPKPTLHHRLRDYGFTVEEAFSKESFRKGPKAKRTVLKNSRYSKKSDKC